MFFVYGEGVGVIFIFPHLSSSSSFFWLESSVICVGQLEEGID